MIKIITDHKWKDFLCRHEVPKEILKSQFDYLSEDEQYGFIKYKGSYHHTSEFVRIPSVEELKGWDGIKNFSFSNGILIKLSKDGESYQIAYYS